MTFSCLFYPHRWTGASSQQWFRYFIDYGNGGWTVRCGAFHWSRLRRGEILKKKQRSNTKWQGKVTGRDRVSFLGFGPVMHMPPEHCHSCTLHIEMVMKSNSNSCVCLDAVSSSTHLRLVHMGDARFQFTHMLESSHGTLQGLINMQLKWQLECFLHLFYQMFVEFFWKGICLFYLFVCLQFVMDGHSIFIDWPQLFQEFNPEIWIPVHWSLHDLTRIYHCLVVSAWSKWGWLQKDGALAPCIDVKPAFIKWKAWKWYILKAFTCKRALN